jgi:hypothetical protein
MRRCRLDNGRDPISIRYRQSRARNRLGDDRKLSNGTLDRHGSAPLTLWAVLSIFAQSARKGRELGTFGIPGCYIFTRMTTGTRAEGGLTASAEDAGEQGAMFHDHHDALFEANLTVRHSGASRGPKKQDR